MDIQYYRSTLMGAFTYIPGISNFYTRFGTGGTCSSRYCYSVWLRHLVTASKNSLPIYPKVVAELGPGDSLGIGLAALLSGSEKYYAFDAVKYTNIDANLKIFEELIDLLKRKERIPDNSEFPLVRPILDSYEFPNQILTQDRLKKALRKERIEFIKKSILQLNCPRKDTMIEYYAPWDNHAIIKDNSVDMIYSQAVMEHVEDIKSTYSSLSRWLKPKGFMSHEIDFKSHGTSSKWNGHFSYSDMNWKLIKGKRKYLINRQAYSSHIRAQKNIGFKIICSIKEKTPSEIEKNQLTPRFRDLTDEDLTICSALIISTFEK